MRVLATRDADVIASVWNQAQPSEPLTEPEIRRVLQHDPGVVIATDEGVIAATAHEGRGHIRLLAVVPRARRRGLGWALLNTAEQWLWDQGVASLQWGAEIPYYLWPGVDRDWTAAVELATKAGYACVGTAVNMSIRTDLEVPAVLPVHRIAEEGARVHAVRKFVHDNWAVWLPEVDLAVQQGTLFAAFDDDRPVGFMAHSTLRRGWLGPMGVDESYRRQGIGAVLLQAACADLADRAFPTAQIAWVGPTDYFARLGATACRTFLRMFKSASDPAGIGN